MIKRLREKYSDEELSRIYSTPHQSWKDTDHNIRVERTIEFIDKNFDSIKNAADLSAGDARIINSIKIEGDKYIGDFAPGYDLTGPIEKTLLEIPKVDLFINSETLEHMDDPQDVLNRIREKTDHLVLSTPVGKFNDTNPEHYWAWDYEGVEELLNKAGFTVFDSDVVYLADQFVYDFQLVACR